MFLETEENVELLELLSQVRAAAALEGEGALLFSQALPDAPHQALQRDDMNITENSARLGISTTLFQREKQHFTVTSAANTCTPSEIQQGCVMPLNNSLASIGNVQKGSWSSLESNPARRYGGNQQLYSVLTSDAYGLSPTSTLPTPAIGGGTAPNTGAILSRGEHVQDSIGRPLSTENTLQCTTDALNNLQPVDEGTASRRRLSFTEGVVTAGPRFDYTTSSTRVVVSPTDAPCNFMGQPRWQAGTHYALCAAELGRVTNRPSSAIVSSIRLADATDVCGRKESISGKVPCEAMPTQQLISACATPPTVSTVLGHMETHADPLQGWGKVQSNTAAPISSFSPDRGSPHPVPPYFQKFVPQTTHLQKREEQWTIFDTSVEGELEGNNCGAVQLGDQTLPSRSKRNYAQQSMNMNFSLPTTPVQGVWREDGCTSTDTWQQQVVAQAMSTEHYGTPQNNIVRERTNEMNIFMLPSPPRPLAAVPSASYTSETGQQKQHMPFRSDSSRQKPIIPTHLHRYLASFHPDLSKADADSFVCAQFTQQRAYLSPKVNYDNTTVPQNPPIITMHAVRPKALAASDPVSSTSRPTPRLCCILNTRTSTFGTAECASTPNSTNMLLSSIAHLQDGHTPCDRKPNGMEAQSGFSSLLDPSQVSESKGNSLNASAGGPRPSERYPHYSQRSVLTSPFIPIQQSNGHLQSQRCANGGTTINVNTITTPKTTKTSNARNSSKKRGCSTGNVSFVHMRSATVGTGRAGSGARHSAGHHSHSAAPGPPNAPGCVSPSIAATLLLFLNTPEGGDNGPQSAHSEEVAGKVLGRQILALSRDQQGCRSLQAVLDCEAANRYGDGTLPSVRVRTLQDYNIPHPSQKDVSVQAQGETLVSGDKNSLRPLSLPLRRIIAALEPHLREVMSDAYGNFLVQKLFEVLSDDERLPLMCKGSNLYKGFGEVACSPHGTFAVQRLVETLRNEAEEEAVFGSLGENMLRLLLDANGGHVLLKVMSYIKCVYGFRAGAVGSVAGTLTYTNAHANGGGEGSTELRMKYRDSAINLTRENACVENTLQGEVLALNVMRGKVRFLYEGLLKNLLVVCQHRQGCCITQKCLDFFAEIFPVKPEMDEASLAASRSLENEDFFIGLVTTLLTHLTTLVMDPYANYVITHMVELCYTRGSIQLVDIVAQRMQERTTLFCKDKYASNVMEHVLRYSSEKRIRAFCRRLLAPSTLVSPKTLGSYSEENKKAFKMKEIHNGGNAVGMTGENTMPPLDYHLCPLIDIALDPFGNYVVQTLLTVAPVDELLYIKECTNTSSHESLELNNERLNTRDGIPYPCDQQANCTKMPNKVSEDAHGLLPTLHRYLPLLQEKSFTRKIETKMELAFLRVEEEKMRRQHQK